jgi:hypothetical protein
MVRAESAMGLVLGLWPSMWMLKRTKLILGGPKLHYV